MYIRDCGYGRSKRCRRRGGFLIGVLVICLGMGGITLQTVAAKEEKTTVATLLPAEGIDMMLTRQNTVEVMTPPVSADLASVEVTCVAEDRTLIVIDPGHGGEDEGCAREGVDEADINLQIALSLRDRLQGMGYEVLLTREKDETLTLEERVKIANDAKADIYVSIHQNTYSDKTVSGIETWYNDSTGYATDSKRLALLIHKDTVLYTDEKDRGLVADDTLHVIREVNMPSCLIETGFLSNTEDRQMLVETGYQERIAEGIASGIDLYFQPKTMYLTFDDGPSPENTGKILDILKERNIKATFFVIGENVRKNPELTRRIVEEGHTIGIHCNWHDYGKLYADVESYVADFEQAYQIVYETTGVEAKLFRFPGGSINAHNKKVYKEIVEEMTAKGYIYFDWNASLEDAVSKGSPEQLIQNAVQSTFGRKKVVMLAHDTVDNTVLCLEELLEALPEYQMEPLTEDVEPVRF